MGSGTPSLIPLMSNIINNRVILIIYAITKKENVIKFSFVSYRFISIQITKLFSLSIIYQFVIIMFLLK